MTLSPRAVEAVAEAMREGIERDDPIKAARDAITAYHAALAVDGLCLVPKEPTMAMLYAGERAWINDPLKRSSTLYRAMIAAASDGEERK